MCILPPPTSCNSEENESEFSKRLRTIPLFESLDITHSQSGYYAGYYESMFNINYYTLSLKFYGYKPFEKEIKVLNENEIYNWVKNLSSILNH